MKPTDAGEKGLESTTIASLEKGARQSAQKT